MNSHKKQSYKRLVFSIILSVLLVTTTLSSMSGASRKTDNAVTEEVVVLNTNYLQYEFEFLEPELVELTLSDTEYSKINMPGTRNIGRVAGEPGMPVSFIKILLPAKKTVKSIHATGDSVLVESPIDLIEKPVFPHQNPVPMGQIPPEQIEKNKQIYQSSEKYPGQIYEEQNIGYSRGYSILTVALTPVQYSPAGGKLWYHPKIMLDIELEDTDNINQFFRNNPDDEEWVKGLVINPEMTDLYRGEIASLEYPGGLCDPSDNYDYVIITTTYNGLDYWSTGGSLTYNWDDLMNRHTSEDGLDCTLVTIQDINTCTDYHDPDPLFNDLEAHIREFCKDAYEDWETDYIFIGGDDEWIPARHMDSSYETDIDSDVYWSNLDLNFNADHDSYWGEEGDSGFDLYAEIFIGRITCDEPQDVSNWMTKSFYYADNVDIDYLDNAAFYGGNLGWNCEGDDFIDYGAIKGTDDWLGPIPGAHGPYPTWLGFQYGFETWNSNMVGMEYDLSVKWTAEPPNPGGWQGGSESAAINGLKTDINNDQVTLISGVAHANAVMSLDVSSSTWESQYHNTKPFFIHDFGCHCGDMDDADDGILHSMLFHSDTELAFACVYNTCYGWGSFDDTNSSSALQMKSFWDYLFDTTNNSGSTQNWQLGKAQAWSKDVMAPTIDWTYTSAPGSWRAVIQGCLLFGDPAQKLKPPLQPDHNIGIQELDVDSHEPADEDIWVGATLYNNGQNDETNVEVKFLVDGILEDTTTISFFAQNSLEDVGWTYHTPAYGWETLTVNVTAVPNEDFLFDNERSKDVIYGPDIAVSQIQAPDHIGLGYPKPVKGLIENLGATDETITIQLIAQDIIINSTSVYLTSGSNTWVEFLWDGSIPGEGTYDITIHAVPVPDEYYLDNQNKSKTVTVFSVLGIILLVDDDDGDAYEPWYEDALLASHFIYDYYDRSSQSSPSPSLMDDYDAVIWFTGTDYGVTLSTQDQNNLATYLDNGGSLFISGQDIGYDIGSSSFYSNYLHANYQTDSAGEEIEGVAGDEIGDGLSFNIFGGDGANNQYWPDGIQPISPATSCLIYSDAPAYKGAIKVDTGTYRVVYISFGFEGIDNMDDRTTVMARSLIWLGDIEDNDPPITTHGFDGTMGDNGWYTSCVTIELMAYDDISGVDITYYRIDGGTWTEYTDPVEFCENGEHTLEYYSVDNVGNEEDVKGPFDFKIDQILPTIELTVENTVLNTWVMTADVADETSGVAKVEFYLDGDLLGEDTEEPFEWEWSGTGSHTVYAIVYDLAGNSQQSEIVESSASLQSYNMPTVKLLGVSKNIL